MIDPFYNLYHIILDNLNNSNLNFNMEVYPNLGLSNPSYLEDAATQNIINLDRQINYLKRRKIIFHDQEPILYNSYTKEWNKKIFNSNRLETRHILSNSEINSTEKNLVLKKSNWADFYWFSNGFLSLEWYRFYKYASYVENCFNPTKTFSTYNRILADREHRLIISGYLLENFKNESVLSCHGESKNNVTNKDFPFDLQQLINKALSSANIFLNVENQTSTNLSYTIDTKDFIDSFCHIVTERIFYEDRIHLTEKIFRPIICCRPFILVSSPGALTYLKQYGFKTFSKFWNEDYDNILDHNARITEILRVINFIGKLSINERINLLNEMKEILLYNRNHFYNSFQTLITNELFQNLNKALIKDQSVTPYFIDIINNLTDAEIQFIRESTVIPDPMDTSYDPFEQSLLLQVMHKNFNKNEISNLTIRQFVIDNVKLLKYHYLAVNAIKRF